MKYTRIDIKSADDLPKVNGEYFAHRIDYNEITFRTFKIGEPKLHYNHAYYLNFWLKNIDWYLLIEDTEPSYPEVNKQHPAVISREQIDAFIESHRKICWESEYENGEFCIGENKVKDFLLRILAKRN